MDYSGLVYDAEIKNAIPDRNGERLEGIQYCNGWGDFQNMKIATICAWDCVLHLPLVFCDDNLKEFAERLADFEFLVSFNGIGFDNKLLAANGIEVKKEQCYDILRELWIADNLDPDHFNPRTHGGYGLDACTSMNFQLGKSGNGALAPIEWQRGKIGSVITYCMRDVMLTRRLFYKILTNSGGILHPKTGHEIRLRMPRHKEFKAEQEQLIEMPRQIVTAVELGE